MGTMFLESRYPIDENLARRNNAEPPDHRASIAVGRTVEYAAYRAASLSSHGTFYGMLSLVIGVGEPMRNVQVMKSTSEQSTRC